jgi:hypothetical protein
MQRRRDEKPEGFAFSPHEKQQHAQPGIEHTMLEKVSCLVVPGPGLLHRGSPLSFIIVLPLNIVENVKLNAPELVD